MAHLSKKLLHPIIAVVLVLTIMGIFVFTRVETPHVIESSENKSNSYNTFTTVDPTIDWLAESTIIVYRTKRAPSLSHQYRLPRLLLLFEIHNIIEYLASFAIYTINPDYYVKIENTIPIKLRI